MERVKDIIDRITSKYFAQLWQFYRDAFTGDEECLEFFYDVINKEPKTTNLQYLEKDDGIYYIDDMLGENTVATHRIIEIVPDKEDPTVLRFRTKGDANKIEDSKLVHYKNVVGKVVATIPYLGYVSDFVQNPPGTYITLGAAAVLILAVFLPDLLMPEKKKETQALEAEAAVDNEKLKAEIETLKARMQEAAPIQPEQQDEES